MASLPQQSTKTADDVLPSLIAVAVTFIVLDTIVVALRFVARTFIQKVPLGADDLLIFPSYVINIALCSIGIVMAKTEMVPGLPAYDVIMEPALVDTVIVPATKCIYSLLPFLYLGAMFPKVSLLSLYLRIFVGRTVRIASLITMGLVICAATAFTLVGLFACQPVQYFWNRSIPGHCINLDRFYRVNTPISIVLDVIILIIPMPALWKLEAPRSKKLGLTVVFALGGCGMLACLGRWIVLLKYTSEVLEPFTTAVIVSWCVLEPSVYLIAACLPPCSSYIMLLANNRHVRHFWSKTTSMGTVQSPNSRKGVFRLSSRQSSGFGRLADSEAGKTGSEPALPSKMASEIHEDKEPGQDVPMDDLGIEVRTDIYVTRSEFASPNREVSLSEMLQQPVQKD